MNNVQIITSKGKPAFAVIPYEDYEKLIKSFVNVENNEDDNALVPNEVVNMIFEDGYNIIKAWRVYLKKTQSEIADIIGIGQSAFAQIEKSKNPQKDTIKKVAYALGINPAQMMI